MSKSDPADNKGTLVQYTAQSTTVNDGVAKPARFVVLRVATATQQSSCILYGTAIKQ